MGGDLCSQRLTAMDDARKLLGYYDRTAGQARLVFYGLTVLRIVLTACIPVVALAAPQRPNPVLFGSLGAAVLVVEALVAMVEPGKKWRRYRAAYMAIDSEMRLSRSKAKHYAGIEDVDRKLAERLDGITTPSTTTGRR